MAGKTLIDGTSYTIKGGKTLVDGTAYSIKQGKTLIDGTAKTIAFSRLPSGWQEVEWIASQSTAQYIDTALIGSDCGGYVFDFMPLSMPNAGSYPFGAQDSASFHMGFYQSGLHIYVANGGFDTYSISASTRYSVNVKAVGTTATASVNGGTTSSITITTARPSVSIYLFSNHYNTSSRDTSVAIRVYATKLYGTDGETLVRNFVPCYCTESKTGYKGSTAVTVASGTVGLYDLVNDRFYVNCGSGTDFTKGADV